jgi:hypothetical protein
VAAALAACLASCTCGPAGSEEGGSEQGSDETGTESTDTESTASDGGDVGILDLGGPGGDVQLVPIWGEHPFDLDFLGAGWNYGFPWASSGFVGDIDADGFDDLAIGASYYPPSIEADSHGRLYFAPGGAGHQSIQLPVDDRFVDGEEYDFCCSVGPAGDVNGDGIDDMLVGRINPERAYVVFGRENFDGLDFDALEEGTGGGFAIPGAEATSFMLTLNDWNEDSRDEIVISDDSNGGLDGRVVVIFGRTEVSPLLEDDLVAGAGIVVDAPPGTRLGYALSVGDVDGDGRRDILATSAPSPGNFEAVLIWGDPTPGALAFEDIEASGRGVMLPPANWPPALVGDVDGDGYDDLAFIDLVGRGRVTFVFGRERGEPLNIDAAAQGTGGFSLVGIEGHRLTRRVVEVGDLDNDGRTDVALEEYVEGQQDLVHVLYGRAGGPELSLSEVIEGNAGYTLKIGDADYPQVGALVGGGDFDGDGYGDLLVTPSAGSGSEPGRGFVVLELAH